MSSSSFQRVLFPGLLLFGLSLALSKSAGNVLLAALYVAALAGAVSSSEFRDDVYRSCRQPLTAALALYCLVAYAGIIHTEKPADGFSVANKFASLPAIYFFVSVLLQSERSEEARARKADLLLISFLAGLTALNLLGVLTFLGVIGGRQFALPLAPLGMHHIWFSNLNALGLYTAVSLLLFSSRGKSARGRATLCCFLSLAALCVLLSMSRTAWLGIAATAMIMAAIRGRKAVFLAALLSLLAFASAYRFVPAVHDRLNLAAENIALFSADTNAESSIGDRLLLWRSGLLMFTSNPLVGVGTGDFVPTLKAFSRDNLVPARLARFNQPHNMYLFSMATNGIVGLSALLFIFYRSLRSATTNMRSGGGGNVFAFLAMATVVHFMVAGFMDSFFNIQVLRYAFAFVLGVCVRSAATVAGGPGHTRPCPLP